MKKKNLQIKFFSKWKTWAQYRNPSLITQLNGIWNTPPLPSRTNSQILYFWNGVEPNDNTAVLQPVLQVSFFTKKK